MEVLLFGWPRVNIHSWFRKMWIFMILIFSTYFPSIYSSLCITMGIIISVIFMLTNYLMMIKDYFQYCLSVASFGSSHDAPTPLSEMKSWTENRPYAKCHHRNPKFLTRFYYTEGWGSVLGCCLPHVCKAIAQLLSLPLGTDVCPHLFLDEFGGPLVLRDLE